MAMVVLWSGRSGERWQAGMIRKERLCMQYLIVRMLEGNGL